MHSASTAAYRDGGSPWDRSVPDPRGKRRLDGECEDAPAAHSAAVPNQTHSEKSRAPCVGEVERARRRSCFTLRRCARRRAGGGRALDRPRSARDAGAHSLRSRPARRGRLRGKLPRLTRLRPFPTARSPSTFSLHDVKDVEATCEEGRSGQSFPVKGREVQLADPAHRGTLATPCRAPTSSSTPRSPT